MHLDLSVVIPTFRRHEKLARALDSLGHQERPPRFEVVVVHNPGDDAAAVDEAIGDRRYPIT
ncbi:MAG: glycosyltransferase family 2 protein, partial [Candidatus Rokuibacteriota bacterium]